VDLRVRPAGSLVGAPPDDDTLGIDDHRANHGIRAGASAAALGERQRTGHVQSVGGCSN
jgi:hypothetical protein